ncbi:hypothetical protein J2W35_004962 [Variovorax boronicumulans]|uniref:hypothetical protein n=1 Tax=Variovorax boronicumulans TaxID=436515 RepID=UPI002783A153|nr:hypothetical protein [Variovorax boronicumulans]MDQ0084593.1 hypothetical protein [Variovorax boronicumulans]
MYTLYPDHVDLDGAWIPLDSDNSDYRAFIEWQEAGGIADTPPVPTHAQLVEMAKVLTRIERQPIITMLDGLQASSLALGQTTRAQIIETAKQGLRDITQTDLSACVTFEEMRLTVKAAYIALAAALPADIRKAFSDALK